MAGDVQAAESHLRQAHELEPNSPTFRTGLGLVLIYLDRKSDAQEILATGLREQPRREFWHVVGRILSHILRQEPEAAHELLEEDLRRDAETDMLYSWLLADCYASLGDTGEAIAWLEHAVDGGFWNHRFFRATDPLLEDLRGSQEFDELMAKAEAGWESIPK